MGKTQELEVQGIGYLHLHRVSDNKGGVIQLGMLANIALKFVDEKINEYHNILLEKSRALPKEKLGKLKQLRVTAQGGLEASKRPR